jgi:ribosomal-protein-alanine N-acetyltransferase
MGPAEQEVNVKYFFRKSEPVIEDASLVLEREGKILGFVITRMKDDEAEIGPIGLIPGTRGQGLGSYLLNLALNNLKSSNFTHASLDVSIENHPARALYKKYGFEDAYFKQFYFWSP